MPVDPKARFLITAGTDFRKARRDSRTFLQNLEQRAKIATRVVGLAAAAGAVATLRLANEAAKSADALAKQSDILGITTQKLAAYQHAARLSGSSNDGLEKGIKKLQKSIVDATNGLTTYTRAFDALRLDPAELKEMTPDQQFETLAKSLANVRTQAERVSIAYDLFGGRNTALLNTLVLTGQQLTKIEADTKAWGTAISRVDAKQLENANDAVERAQTALQGIATTVAIAIAPLREDLANSFADSAAEAQGFRSEIQGTMEALVVGANFAANAIRGIQVALLGARLAALKIQELGARLSGGGENQRAALEAQIKNLEIQREIANERTREAIDKQIAQVRGQFDFIGQETSVDDILAEQDAVGRALDALVTKFQSADQALASFREKQAAAVEAARASINPELADPNLALFTDKELEAFQARMQEREDIRVQLAQQTARRLLQIERKKEQDRQRLVDQSEKAIRAQKEQTQQLAVGLLQALGAENKSLAIAAIVVEKAMAIQRVLLANKVASWLAFASQLIPGDPTSLLRAHAARTSVLAQGRVSAALIAATGAVQVATLGSGSTGAPLGTPTNPVFTNSGDQARSEEAVRRVVEVNIHGGVIMQDQLSRILRDAIDADEVIIHSSSRQAAEIRNG